MHVFFKHDQQWVGGFKVTKDWGDGWLNVKSPTHYECTIPKWRTSLAPQPAAPPSPPEGALWLLQPTRDQRKRVSR